MCVRVVSRAAHTLAYRRLVNSALQQSAIAFHIDKRDTLQPIQLQFKAHFD